MQKEVLITKVADTFGFGVCTEDYQDVYIPSSLLRAFKIFEGERYKFVLRHNNRDGHVPWFAAFLVTSDEPQTASKEPIADDAPFDIKKAVHQAIGHYGVCATIEICDFIADEFDHNIETRAIGPYIEQLHKDERIVRIGVTSHPDQKRASFVMWAKDVKTVKEYFDADE